MAMKRCQAVKMSFPGDWSKIVNCPPLRQKRTDGHREL
jgi:hypothetical protein